MNKNTHSFDLKNGFLAVDYKSWISKQDVVYNSPAEKAWDAAFAGNGKTGAAVWNENGLDLQITSVDSSPHTCFSSGLVSLITEPSMLDCNGFHQRINLYDATVETQFGDRLKTTVFGVPGKEMLGILVEDNRENVSEVTVRFGIWDITTTQRVQWLNEVKDFEEWKKMEWQQETPYPFFLRGDTSFDEMGYGLGVSVDGTDFNIKRVDEYNFELKLTPASKYTIWIMNPCKVNLKGLPALKAADRMLFEAVSEGTESVLNRHRAFWNDYWQHSFVKFTDNTESGEYIENTWYTGMYMLALHSHATYMGHFFSSVFRWAGDSNIRWCQYYTHFNQRAINNHWLAVNHPELIRPYLDWLCGIVPQMMKDTQEICGHPGLKMFEAPDFKGRGMYDLGDSHTGHIFTNGLEDSLLMFQYAMYTNDMDYLKNVCFPYFTEAVRFLTSRYSYDGRYYHIHDSNCLEMFWDITDPLSDLIALRAIFPLFIKLSCRFGGERELREKVRHMLDNIAPVAMGEYNGKLYYLPCPPPVPEPKNSQNPEMDIIFPYGYTGIGTPDRETGVNTWLHREYEYNIWSPDAVAAARLGLGDLAYDGIVKMCLQHQIHPCGFHDDNNGAMESNGLCICTVNEMMLQSHSGLIRVFPAMPSADKFEAAFTLRAMGGFIISSERKQGRTKYVGIKSLYGNPVKISNPWKGERVRVLRGGVKVLETISDEINFGTLAGDIIILENTETPFDSFCFEKITTSKNTAPKTFAAGYIAQSDLEEEKPLHNNTICKRTPTVISRTLGLY